MGVVRRVESARLIRMWSSRTNTRMSSKAMSRRECKLKHEVGSCISRACPSIRAVVIVDVFYGCINGSKDWDAPDMQSIGRDSPHVVVRMGYRCYILRLVGAYTPTDCLWPRGLAS